MDNWWDTGFLRIPGAGVPLPVLHPVPAPRPAGSSASGASTGQPPPPGGNGSDPFFGGPVDPTAWGTPQSNPFYNSDAHPGDSVYFNAGLGPDPVATVRNAVMQQLTEQLAGMLKPIGAVVARLGLVLGFGATALVVLVLMFKPYLT